MSRVPSSDTFVVGMSLAEILLLLIFVLLLIGSANTGGSVTLELEQLRQENDSLKARNTALEARVANLEEENAKQAAIINALAGMAGVPVERAEDVPGLVDALKRGFPVCATPNTLVEVAAANGSLTLTVLFELNDLPPPSRTGSVRTGEIIADSFAVQSFLESVRRYGDRASRQCRFDYRLRYVTSEDYRFARETLEKYLYPRGIRRVGG